MFKKLFYLICFLFSFTVFSKSIVVAYDADPVSLDPFEQISSGTLQQSHLSFDPLVRFSENLDFEMRLAVKYEQKSPLIFRVYLRKGVKFHSGREMTAKDVQFSLERIKQSLDFKAIFSPISKAQIVDDYTIDFVTEKPFPLMLQTLTYLFVMDKSFYSGKTKDGRAKDEIVKNKSSFASLNVSGTGPFIVKHRQQGIKLEMARFNDYWDKKGNITKLTIVPIKEDATRVSSLLSGDVDFIGPVSPNDFGIIERNKNKVTLLTKSGTRIIVMQLNQKSQAAFKNIKVRQAVSYAVNNEAIVKKVMKGFGTAAGQLSSKGYLGYDAKLKPQYDLEKAKALMKEAGYEKGFTISMIAPNNRYINDEKIAQAVSAMLAKINIKVNLKTYPKAQYWPEFDNCSADMLMIGWHSDTEDSANLTEFLRVTRSAETGAGAYNCGYYSNKEVDSLIVASNQEVDPNKRSVLLKKAEGITYAESASVVLHVQNLSWATKANKFSNISEILNPMNFPYFGDLIVK